MSVARARGTVAADDPHADGAPEAVSYGMAAMGAFSVPGPRPAAARPAVPASRPLASRAAIAGMDATLDPSGALYWDDQATLIVADLHLETGSSYARKGQLLPPHDSAITLARLAEVVAHYRPARLIALGDSFHDPFGPERLGAPERALLTDLCAGHDVVWITGNHDGDCSRVLGGTAADDVTLAGVTFRHIPGERLPDTPEVAGHLHPAARVELRGRSVKRRAFVGCARRLILPAFGALTGGIDVLGREFAHLWSHAPQVHMIGKRRVYSL
ncbi:MAG: ligase-associated DNA damage response endonuclease PdeM [Acuticoccus sp.]